MDKDDLGLYSEEYSNNDNNIEKKATPNLKSNVKWSQGPQESMEELKKFCQGTNKKDGGKNREK